MPFLAVGVEHKTAPLLIRERIALDASGIERLSAELKANEAIAELAILSTCNRTEIYLYAEDADQTAIAASAALDDGTIGPHIHRWDEQEAIEHLFRVASGLESQILGEPQILSQIRETHETAQRLDTLGPNLHSLFRAAIRCGRHARAGTTLGRVNLSAGTEAVRAAEEVLGTLEGRAVLVIGGGEISRLAAEELHRYSPARLYVANRTATVAEDVAQRFGGTAATLNEVPALLGHVDLVITATGARQYIVRPEDVPRRESPLHIYDLAIPRDVDPAVGLIQGVVLHDLDSLLPSGAAAHWEEDIRSMESVIAGEVQEFTAWVLTRRVVPVIASLRSHVEAVSLQELERVAPHLADLTDRERAAVESLTQRLIDKMFHHLVTRLRLAAQTDPALVDAAEFFFLHGEGGLFPHAAEQQEHSRSQREP